MGDGVAPQIAGVVTIAVLSAGIVHVSGRFKIPSALRRTALPTLALVGGVGSAVLSGGWTMIGSPEVIVAHVGAVYALAHAVNSRWLPLLTRSHQDAGDRGNTDDPKMREG